MSAAGITQIAIKDPLDLTPLRTAQTARDACSILKGLIEALERRNHALYYCELQELDDMMDKHLIDLVTKPNGEAKEGNLELIEVIQKLQSIHSSLPSEIDSDPKHEGKWEYLPSKV